ncbi:MAG: HAD-IB family hydrolase [Actinomycetaceae bacterium]|nr:HAD-IB family hydrolase [Actinomycetaceae bacterium]
MKNTETDAAPGTIGAFFDVDETLIRGSSSFILARALWRRGIITLADLAYGANATWQYIVFGENRRHIDKLVARALQCMAGHSEEELIGIGEEIYENFFASRLYPQAKSLLDEHRAAGHEVWLISATPSQITHLLARRLGADGGVGTEVTLRDGRFTAELASPLMHGPGKVSAMRGIARKRGIDLGASYAYSDSVNDLPMLRAVGHPNAINPDPKLRLVALAAGWRIYDLRKRKRTDMEQKAKTTAKRSAHIGLVWWLFRLLRRRFSGRHGR